MMCSVSSRSPSEPPRLDAGGPIPATAGLCVGLILVHGWTAFWWTARHGDPIMETLLEDRAYIFRRSVGGQTLRAVESGEVWRLASSVLLHVDFWHLCFNVLALWALGRMLEPIVGSRRLIAWCALGGVCGSLASHFAGVLRSDGASGAAFALLGAAVVVGWRHREEWQGWDRRLFGEVLWVLVVLNLVLGAVVPSVDGVAHVGGLAAGLLLAQAQGASRVHWAMEHLSWVGFLGLVCWGMFTIL